MHERIVKDFLTLRLKAGARLLLGLSGGPDSMALLHLLMEAKKTLDFSLHIAHVDHGWREESKEEAAAVRHVAGYFNLPFFLHRLGKMEGSDLENRCRKERLAFFSRLHREHGYQALLLAHHGGDQAETIFKRIAEGAGIEGLGGLYPERKLGDLLVWRPLLSMQKEELIAYLKKKKLSYFEDSTNKDPAYLRSRMREELFPRLETIFGKRMEKNFSRLGKMFQEFSSYFEEKSVALEKLWVNGPLGSYLDLSLSFHPLELKIHLKKRAPFTRESLEMLIKLIKLRKTSREVHVGETVFQLSRPYLFQIKKEDFFSKPCLWEEKEGADWKGFWVGKIAPHKGGELKKLSDLDPYLKRRLKKWYAYHRVPTFLHDKAPIYLRDGEIQETLTGRGVQKMENLLQ